MNNNENLNIILKALKEGDRIVFENLYSKYYQELCTFLISYTNDTDIIEDVVQDVFLKIWINKKNLSIKTSLSGYLYKMAYTDLMGKYRQIKKKNNLLASYYHTALIQAVENNQDQKNKRLKKLEKCIDQLPDRCKLVFKENKIAGLKYSEVAEKLNISLKTVEGHISRALAILKECMK